MKKTKKTIVFFYFKLFFCSKQCFDLLFKLQIIELRDKIINIFFHINIILSIDKINFCGYRTIYVSNMNIMIINFLLSVYQLFCNMYNIHNIYNLMNKMYSFY